MAIHDFLERNRQWAKERLENDPDYFRRHLTGQKPRLLVISCSDSRVPIERILRCGPGDVFVHRNVANVVAYNDINIAAVLQYAVEVLKVPDIVVCGHYICGGVEAACADEIRTGYIGDWLMITSWAKKWVDERLGAAARTMARDQYLRLVVEENVKLQIRHVAQLSVMRDAWRADASRPQLHGWVYDLSTGLINVIVDGHKESDRAAVVKDTRAAMGPADQPPPADR